MKIALLALALLLAACAPQAPIAPLDEAWIAPEIDLPTLDGGALRLSDLRGEWVILTFWATWCAPCAVELPALQTVHASSAVNVIAVNMREKAESVQIFADRLGLTFPILLSPTDAVVLAYTVMGLPQTFVISPSGEIVWRGFGPGLPPPLWAES